MDCYFLKGLILGCLIAAPVGPIGVLCIQRTLAFGALNGFISGLGAASADAVYGLIAAFGLSFISSSLLSHQLLLHLSGGLYLLYLGFRAIAAPPAKTAASAHRSSLFPCYTSVFFLTLTNPMTILSFAAVFTGLGTPEGLLYSLFLVLGVFLGSTLWWLILSSAVTLLRKKFNHHQLNWVNRLAGTIIAAFGVFSLASI